MYNSILKTILFIEKNILLLPSNKYKNKYSKFKRFNRKKKENK